MRFNYMLFSLLLLVCLLLLSGCPWLEDFLYRSGYGTAITDAYGETSVRVEDKRIDVIVRDERGNLVPGATVKAYALEEGVLIFAGSEDHFPGITILTPADFSPVSSSGLSRVEPELAVTTVAIMIISAIDLALTFYDYYKNPGEFPIQIPGLLEGSRKVERICFQIDGNDLLALGSALRSGLDLYKGILVLGAPAKTRGVTAIKYGMTKKKVKGKIAELLAEEFGKIVGILDTDLINTCTYRYKTREGYEEMPFLTLDIQRGPIRTDVAHLFIEIVPSPTFFNTSLAEGVGLGWNYTVTIRELKGIGVDITDVKFHYYDISGNFLTTIEHNETYFDACFRTHRVSPKGSISADLVQRPFAKEDIASTKWVVSGIDDNGNRVEATATVHLRPNVSRGMMISLNPVPIPLEPKKGWRYEVTITEISGISVTIKGVEIVLYDENRIMKETLQKDSNFIGSTFGTNYLSANGSISTSLFKTYDPSLYMIEWVIVGINDNGDEVYGASGLIVLEQEGNLTQKQLKATMKSLLSSIAPTGKYK